MPQLFVANAQHQDHQFFWRLPEQDTKSPPYQMVIRAGGQAQIPGDLRDLDIETVVRYHIRYGMVKAGDRLPEGRAPLLYSDKPIKLGVIQAAVLHNRECMKEDGQSWRNRTAIAINSRIKDNIFEMQLPDQLRVMDVSIQEDGRDNQFSEGISVRDTADTAAEGNYRRRNARRSR